MLFTPGAIVLVLAAATSSLAYTSPEARYVRRALNADPYGVVARGVYDRLLQTREVGQTRQAFDLDTRDTDAYEHIHAVRRFDDLAPKAVYARAGGGGGGKGGGGNKGKGGGGGGNCREACKFCKDKKGSDGKPCAYVDLVAPPGVDKKRFDKCKEQLAQNAGVNPSGMGAVSAGGGAGGSAAIAITGAITSSHTKSTCAGVHEKVMAAISSGGGQCC